MTEEQLQEIETRLSNTGEWDEYVKGEGEDAHWEASFRWSEEFASNVESDITALLAEVRKLRAELDEWSKSWKQLGEFNVTLSKALVRPMIILPDCEAAREAVELLKQGSE